MTDQLYRIRPLEWYPIVDQTSWWSRPWGMGYDIKKWAQDKFIWYPSRAAGLPLEDRTTTSLEAAQAACEAHYRERLAEALEPVRPAISGDLQWVDRTGAYELIELVDGRCHSIWNGQPLGFHSSLEKAKKRARKQHDMLVDQ